MALEEFYTVDRDLSVEDQEWEKLKKVHLEEGFREGKSLGEETYVQSGFDQGYIRGFEISYPISVIKGLLAVNKLLLKGNKAHLLVVANKIEYLLKEFEKKCSQYKLSNVIFVKVTSDIQNDNISNLLKDKCTVDANETLKVDRLKLNEVNSDFNALKENILLFINQCQQPLLLNQISQVFEKWEYKHIMQSERVTSNDLKIPESCQHSDI